MLKIHPEVLNALQNNLPVVALESTIISHGLPRPRNHQAALDFEQILRDKGVVPATIAVIEGIPNIGLAKKPSVLTVQSSWYLIHIIGLVILETGVTLTLTW